MSFKTGDRVRVIKIDAIGTISHLIEGRDIVIVRLDVPRKIPGKLKLAEFKLARFHEIELLAKLKANPEFKDLWDKAAEDDENE